jgi:hypothetical protein
MENAPLHLWQNPTVQCVLVPTASRAFAPTHTTGPDFSARSYDTEHNCPVQLMSGIALEDNRQCDDDHRVQV